MRVAIVGSGVSGLVVAHHLAREHEITVFEAGEHVGGHVRTQDVGLAAGGIALSWWLAPFGRAWIVAPAPNRAPVA